MIVKFETGCAFAGTETTHYVDLPDDSTDEYLDAYLEDLIAEDIAPYGSHETITDEDELAEIYDEYDIE